MENYERMELPKTLRMMSMIMTMNTTGITLLNITIMVATGTAKMINMINSKNYNNKEEITRKMIMKMDRSVSPKDTPISSC